MTHTENYNFALPDDDDRYDISTTNENFEALDDILAENESNLEEINEKIGTPAETGQTLFTLLGNKNASGLTAIKSIQRITSGNLIEKTKKTVSIDPVDPTKCLCILERLQDHSTITENTNYTLNTDSVTFTAPGLSYDFIVGLWVIEFY